MRSMKFFFALSALLPTFLFAQDSTKTRRNAFDVFVIGEPLLKFDGLLSCAEYEMTDKPLDSATAAKCKVYRYVASAGEPIVVASTKFEWVLLLADPFVKIESVQLIRPYIITDSLYSKHQSSNDYENLRKILGNMFGKNFGECTISHNKYDTERKCRWQKDGMEYHLALSVRKTIGNNSKMASLLTLTYNRIN